MIRRISATQVVFLVASLTVAADLRTPSASLSDRTAPSGSASGSGSVNALATGTVAASAPASRTTDRASIDVGRYHLQSNIWVNLHQRLMYEARFPDATPMPLAGDDLAKWGQAVEDYRSYLGKRHPIFDRELIALNATLSNTTDASLPESIPKGARDVLASAMPLYRAAQWEADDRANRFWMAVAEPMLASAGEELAQAHAKAYGVPFPSHIRVDVTTWAWEFGAYTVGEGESAHAVIASIVPGNQGFAALEALVHEPSHAIVDASSGAVGADLTRISKDLGVRPMSNLWHAILFYTSGELTRRALEKRGVPDYKPVISFMYDGPFRGDRKPLESHWQAYLDGKVSRDEAIRQILIETSPKTNP